MVTRRKFLKLLALVWGSLSFIIPGELRAKKLALSLDRVEKLKDIGGWVVLKIKERDVLFIRDTAETVKVFNPVCTHKQCTVEYDPENTRIQCPCHGSRYDLEGNVLNGPAREPLTRFESELTDGRILFEMEE